MFNGIPTIQNDKVQNMELYVQKKIYESLKLLNIIPSIQNESGLFTSYMQGDVEVADPEYVANNITYNEIKFGEGSTLSGQIKPVGFMYKASTRDEQRGRYMAQLQQFYNQAVIKIADFYETLYIDSIKTGGRASTATLEPWDTAENIITNEVILDDEMRYDSNDNATGFVPNTVLCNRKDGLVIDAALRKENYTESNFNYVSSSKIPEGEFIVFDMNNPGAVIEKFVDPEYSVIQSLENDGLTTTEDGTVIPPAFLNISEVKPNRPQTIENYIWAESALNIQNNNGFLVIQ